MHPTNAGGSLGYIRSQACNCCQPVAAAASAAVAAAVAEKAPGLVAAGAAAVTEVAAARAVKSWDGDFNQSTLGAEK